MVNGSPLFLPMHKISLSYIGFAFQPPFNKNPEITAVVLWQIFPSDFTVIFLCNLFTNQFPLHKIQYSTELSLLTCVSVTFMNWCLAVVLSTVSQRSPETI